MQQVLAYETDLLEYGDLFDGSTVIEAKTAELGAAAAAELDDVQPARIAHHADGRLGRSEQAPVEIGLPPAGFGVAVGELLVDRGPHPPVVLPARSDPIDHVEGYDQ